MHIPVAAYLDAARHLAKYCVQQEEHQVVGFQQNGQAYSWTMSFAHVELAKALRCGYSLR